MSVTGETTARTNSRFLARSERVDWPRPLSESSKKTAVAVPRREPVPRGAAPCESHGPRIARRATNIGTEAVVKWVCGKVLPVDPAESTWTVTSFIIRNVFWQGECFPQRRFSVTYSAKLMGLTELWRKGFMLKVLSPCAEVRYKGAALSLCSSGISARRNPYDNGVAAQTSIYRRRT
jgi:hypothetical protein